MPSPPYVELTTGLLIDVDGAPNAYGPPGQPTLDDEWNAHQGTVPSGRIVGYLLKPDGTPEIQGPGDPYPGYYISCTHFHDRDNHNRLDPRRYLDASKINYVVRGRFGEERHVEIGDFAVVFSRRYHRRAYAIVGDSGNDEGNEGSLALLQALGYPFDSGKTGEAGEGEIVIRYFPGTNPQNRFFHTQQCLDKAAKALDLNIEFPK